MGTLVPARLVHPYTRIQEGLLPRRYFERLDKVSAGCLTFIFDDGKQSDMKCGFELGEHFEMRYVFAPTTSKIGQPTYLSGAALKDIAANGHEIASHGVTHLPMTSLTGSMVRHEFRESRDRLEDLTQSRVRHFVYPFGLNSRFVRREAANYYQSAFTTWQGINSDFSNKLALRRVPFGSYCKPGMNSLSFFIKITEKIMKNGGWLVWMLHTDAPEHDSYQQSMLTAYLSYVREAGLPVVTISEAMAALASNMKHLCA